MKSETTFDFSIRSVPDEWKDAAEQAPELDAGIMRAKRTVRVRPSTERVDIMTSVIAALAISGVTGVAWYLFETRGVSDSPLLAILLGLVISIAVRLGGGPGDPDIRATISFIFYLTTVLAVAYMVERYDYQVTYRATPNLDQTEYWIVRDRLKEPTVILGWAAGLVLSTQISYVTRERR